MDIIHTPAFYLTHEVSETEFCLPSSGGIYSRGPNRKKYIHNKK
jgi:hypothetical protein